MDELYGVIRADEPKMYSNLNYYHNVLFANLNGRT